MAEIKHTTTYAVASLETRPSPSSAIIIITLTFESYRSYGGRRPGRFSQISHVIRGTIVIMTLYCNSACSKTSHHTRVRRVTFTAEAPIKTALRYIAELIGPLFALLTPIHSSQIASVTGVNTNGIDLHIIM